MTNSKSNQYDWSNKALLKWFSNLQLYLPLLPFNQRSRNNRIRPEIIKRVLGLVLTDDERAELWDFRMVVEYVKVRRLYLLKI